jgi:hypothetical protein
MTEPFGVEIKFNVLYETGRGVNIKIMEATSDYLLNCADIILNDCANEFNHEAIKCHDKLVRKAIDVIKKAKELRKMNYE